MYVRGNCMKKKYCWPTPRRTASVSAGIGNAYENACNNGDVNRIGITLAYFFLVIGVPGGYAALRYIQTPAYVDFSEPATFADIAPTTCEYSWSSFTSSGRSHVYVADGIARLDLVDTRNGIPMVFHIVVDSKTASVFEWGDDSLGITKLTVAELQEIRDRLKPPEEKLPPMDCGPWWLVNEDVFIPPLNEG